MLEQKLLEMITQTQEDIRNCRRCPLCKYMPVDSKPVPGCGNSNAKMMFIGEALGENEAITGVPFCGLAGQLFDKMLEGAGIIRQDCYISNVVHCRPTVENKGFKNRPPTPEEIQRCKKWIYYELLAVNPHIVVTLGKIPTYTLLHKQLNKNFSILKIMGDKYKVDYHRAVVCPVPHPSYILQRNMGIMDRVIEIFKEIKM